jgi:sensor histidine kinase YesM
VLQPLLENAVRHGIEPREGGGSVTVRAARDGPALRVEVVDAGAGAAQPRRAGNGVGLANTGARLRHLHGGDARLELDAMPDGGTCARIVVPYRTAPAERVA